MYSSVILIAIPLCLDGLREIFRREYPFHTPIKWKSKTTSLGFDSFFAFQLIELFKKSELDVKIGRVLTLKFFHTPFFFIEKIKYALRMFQMKTKRAAAKRYKITGTGKIKIKKKNMRQASFKLEPT